MLKFIQKYERYAYADVSKGMTKNIKEPKVIESL